MDTHGDARNQDDVAMSGLHPDGGVAEFVSEGQEQIADLERLLLGMEPPKIAQREDLNACFRAVHSLKAGASFLDLTNLASLAHAAEQLLDEIRVGPPATGVEISTLLEVATQMRQRLHQLQGRPSTERIAATTSLAKRVQEQALARTTGKEAAPPASGANPSQLNGTAPQDALTRRAGPSPQNPSDYEERQRFVSRVLDLMLHAETKLLHQLDAQALAEARRSLSAVKAMAAFLGHAAVACEATRVQERVDTLPSSGVLGDDDRAWLLGAIDRVRLLAVDPHRGTTAAEVLVPVALERIERLTALAEDLAGRLSHHADPEVAWLMAEIRSVSRTLLLLPVQPLLKQLRALAEERDCMLETRGDHLALDRATLDILAGILPLLVAHLEHGSEATLLVACSSNEVVIRLRTATEYQPTAAAHALVSQHGGIFATDEEGSLQTLRLPRPLADNS
jgi:HPt (histidine-containing phosphotransfer) domain-containing protein